MKRSKSKIEIHVGINDFYKYYKDNNTKNPLIDRKLYSKVIKENNEAISNAIIYDGMEFKMPARLGYLSVIKKKHKLKFDENGKVDVRYLPVDYQATKKLWARIYPGLSEEEILKIPDRKRVFHKNMHSDGYIYSWYYDKYTSNAKNKSVYYFKPTRTNTRNLAAHIKSEDFDTIYYEYSND
mgnify:FL=1